MISEEWTATPRGEDPLFDQIFLKTARKRKKKIGPRGVGESQTLLCRYVTALVKKRS